MGQLHPWPWAEPGAVPPRGARLSECLQPRSLKSAINKETERQVWNTRPAKTMPKWEVTRTWLRDLVVGKEKKKRGGPLGKSKSVNSFSLDERALDGQGVSGYSDIRENAKIYQCVNHLKFKPRYSNGCSRVKASGEVMAAWSLHINGPVACTDLGSGPLKRKWESISNNEQVLLIMLLGIYSGSWKLTSAQKSAQGCL